MEGEKGYEDSIRTEVYSESLMGLFKAKEPIWSNYSSKMKSG